MAGVSSKEFYFNAVQLLARSLASLKPAPWEKVNHLLNMCPQETTQGIFKFDQRGQDAVFALGVYFLQSGCQYQENIFPYFMKLLRGLAKAIWIEEARIHDTDRIPVSERFAFCLNTLLSDIACFCEDLRDEVGHSDKLLKRYFGPYQVLRQLSEVTYEVQDFDPTSRRRKPKDIVHVLRMKPYYPPEAQADVFSDASTTKQDVRNQEPNIAVPETTTHYSGPTTRSHSKNCH